MKFVLFVEGETETGLHEFFQRWLESRLKERVGFKFVRFRGWHQYHDEIAKRAHLNLSGKLGADAIAGIGLLDLYGPTYAKNKKSIDERYAWAKETLERSVDHPKFRQHFAVHETEAWLLADPAILPRQVMRALPGRSEWPETVNFDEPPAKLLERLYREKKMGEYRKLIDGRILFRKLSPDRAYEKCPYLKALLDDMLSLAQAALG
jgi:hypothetical protein